MENVILNRFANRSWLGTEVLIFSEVPEYGERLSERLNKLNPTQELRTHVFTKYNDAHDCAKKLKNLGILIFIESDSGTHPPQDIIRELLTPFETRGTPGVSLIFSEKELTVRGAIASKKANSCVDYLPYTITENSENLLKIFKNLTIELQKKFEDKIYPIATQDFFSKLRNQTEENRFFEERVIESLTAKLNCSWLEGLKAKWGVSIFGVYQKHPQAIKGGIFEKCVALEKINQYQNPLPLHSKISASELPHVLAGFVYKLSESISHGNFEETLHQFISDEEPSSFDDGYFRVLYREKNNIVAVYQQYFETNAPLDFKRKSA